MAPKKKSTSPKAKQDAPRQPGRSGRSLEAGVSRSASQSLGSANRVAAQAKPAGRLGLAVVLDDDVEMSAAPASPRAIPFTDPSADWSEDGAPGQFVLETLVALDGFGVFLKGATSAGPFSPVTAHLKLDSLVLEADKGSLSRRRAPDGAGQWACLFRTAAPVPAARDLRLKFTLADGRAVVCRLSETVLERIVPDRDFPHQAFYPHLEREAFFGDYARAYYRLCAAAYARSAIEQREAAPAQMVFAAPTERSARFLLINQIKHYARKASAAGVGITLVAAEEQRHDDLLELFFSLKEDLGGPCSLALVQDPAAALWALDTILPAVGANRFAYVGANVALSARGWAALAASLESDSGLASLQASDPFEPWAEPDRAMNAFVWTTGEFLAWRRSVVLPVGVAPSLGVLAAEASMLPNCGAIDLSAVPSPLLLKINRHAGVEN